MKKKNLVEIGGTAGEKNFDLKNFFFPRQKIADQKKKIVASHKWDTPQ